MAVLTKAQNRGSTKRVQSLSKISTHHIFDHDANVFLKTLRLKSLSSNRFVFADSLEICTNHEIISGADSFLTSVGLQSENKNILQDFKANTWYRFADEDGFSYRAPTTCIPENRCGTKYTGYISEYMPTVNQGVLKRKLCFNQNGNCCGSSMNIYVRNCNQLYVYKLEAKLKDETGICLQKYRTGKD